MLWKNWCLSRHKFQILVWVWQRHPESTTPKDIHCPSRDHTPHCEPGEPNIATSLPIPPPPLWALQRWGFSPKDSPCGSPHFISQTHFQTLKPVRPPCQTRDLTGWQPLKWWNHHQPAYFSASSHFIGPWHHKCLLWWPLCWPGPSLIASHSVSSWSPHLPPFCWWTASLTGRSYFSSPWPHQWVTLLNGSHSVVLQPCQ